MTNAPLFHADASRADGIRPILPASYLLEYLRDGRTPIRAISDLAISQSVPLLSCDGTIIELGAAGDYYKKFFPSTQRYCTSDISGAADMVLDMTKMDLPDNSVAAFISTYSLEHVFDFAKVFQEVYRTLLPGGRFLLIVPFLYHYHAAPDDYFRFSRSCIEKLLDKFNVLTYVPIGNREIFTAELYHEKSVLGSGRGALWRFAIRCLALPVLAAGVFRCIEASAFTPAHYYLCEKPA